MCSVKKEQKDHKKRNISIKVDDNRQIRAEERRRGKKREEEERRKQKHTTLRSATGMDMSSWAIHGPSITKRNGNLYL